MVGYGALCVFVYSVTKFLSELGEPLDWRHPFFGLLSYLCAMDAFEYAARARIDKEVEDEFRED